MSSVYDPLGLICPVVLTGKQILQELVRDGEGWDEPVGDSIRARWERWILDLKELARLQIPRCYRNPGGSPVEATAELHCFSDASNKGYGQCSYLRLRERDGTTSSALVMAKARVAPSKPITVPRLELAAAVVSVKIGAFLQRELDIDNMTTYYWTDSKVALGYITNDARRFHVYVANRVQHIRDNSEVHSWNYVRTEQNPADIASRGISARDIVNNTLWWKGPNFLQSKESLPVSDTRESVNPQDPELRKAPVHMVHSTSSFVAYNSILERLSYFSDWHRMKRSVAICMRYRSLLRYKASKEHGKVTSIQDTPISVSELQEAEKHILKTLQQTAFPNELRKLNRMEHAATERDECRKCNTTLKTDSSLYRLDPYVSSDGLLRVGGRIRRADVPYDARHPVILPKKEHITQLIIRHYHCSTGHSGREMTLSEIRAAGYWIIQGRSAVTSVVHSCVVCRRLRATPASQKMANLPDDRVQATAPFTFSAVDFFGPFYIREGRSDKKRWGVLFTCLSCRAVHVETANSLSTDSFINAYRRFVGRRGPVRQLRCDRGTNFVGARSELESALQEMSKQRIGSELLKDNCDWITFKFNPPYASHMGGSWERMIRSVRSVLSSLLLSHGDRLDDEQLRTFLIEAESIVNSRPITYQDDTPGEADTALTPAQLLTLKPKVILPPPGEFVKEDRFCRKRWRCVQYMADQFWTRWLKEYLASQQNRQKWQRSHANLKPGDIVLLVDEQLPRCQWPLGRVQHVFPSDDGLVRKITVVARGTTYDRPVHKVVPLLSTEDPDKEPKDTFNDD